MKQGSRRRLRKKHTGINSPHIHRLKFTGKVLKQEATLLKVLKLDAEGNTEEPKVSTNLWQEDQQDRYVGNGGRKLKTQKTEVGDEGIDELAVFTWSLPLTHMQVYTASTAV